eukprot:365381-Chlamydomonas_euryale.AAC.16
MTTLRIGSGPTSTPTWAAQTCRTPALTLQSNPQSHLPPFCHMLSPCPSLQAAAEAARTQVRRLEVRLRELGDSAEAQVSSGRASSVQRVPEFPVVHPHPHHSNPIPG